MNETSFFKIKAKVKIFPQKGGWHYVDVPEEYTEMSKHLADRGLVPIEAKIEGTSWKTSLLPMGNGNHFLALNKKVRDKEKIELGKEIEVLFRFSQ